MHAKLVVKNQCEQQYVLLVVFIVMKVMNLLNYILKDILDVTVAIRSLERKNVI